MKTTHTAMTASYCKFRTCCLQLISCIFLLALASLLQLSTTVSATPDHRELHFEMDAATYKIRSCCYSTVPFSYIEASGRGPSKWGQLNSSWKACGDGKSQSPIDILDQNVQVKLAPGELKADYKPANATILSTGYNIRVVWKGDAGKIYLNGTDYNLQHLHWHVPAEHAFNGKRHDMELHVVHANSRGETTVVAIVYKYGNPDPFLSKLFPYVKSASRREKSLGIVNPNDVAFGSRKYYKYIGSLSTPPCSEGVIWIVDKKVKTVSMMQVQALRDAVDDGYQANARPIQPLNGRAIYLYNH